MKRPVFPLLSKIALILSGVLFFCYGLIKFLELQNIYIYISGVDAKDISPCLLIPGAFFLICAGAIFLFLNCKHIILRILIVLLALAVSFVTYFYLLFSLMPTGSIYHEFISDDQQHTIIVNEQSILLSGFGEIYEKTSFCTMKQVGKYTTDDGYRPFSSNGYFFVWNEDNFELHYCFGSGFGLYKVIEMEYAK